MSETASSAVQPGPPLFELVRATVSGSPALQMFEFPIYSDAHVTGELVDPPVLLINNVCMGSGVGDFRPAIVARVLMPAIEYTPTPVSETDVRLYHGGTIADEVAAVMSLHMGVRAQAGGVNRQFETLDGPGRPIGYYTEPWPSRRVVKNTERLRLPWALGSHVLPDGMFLPLAELTAIQAAAFMKAARSYQKAMWIGEWEPEQAWLHLVAAIEAVSQFVSSTSATKGEQLLEYHPKIGRLALAAGGPEHLEELAHQLNGIFGSTRRFCDFVLEYLPEPPADRPQINRLTWTAEGLKPVIKLIYEHRSRALHDGTPFPHPMCEAPPYLQPGDRAPIERPLFIGTSTLQGHWLAEDVPTFLHVFAYIVQQTLLAWWRATTGASG